MVAQSSIVVHMLKISNFIGRAVGTPGYGKYVVDVLNYIEK